MADKKENPHSGHRQRMRDKFIADGNFDSFAPHNVLELLLFYSVPRADTNELAHALIDKFGSLKGVFDAPYEALLAIDNVGQNTAILIKLVQSLVKSYNDRDAANIKYVRTTADAVNYLRPKFDTHKNESMLMLCMNQSGKLIKCSLVSNGSINSTPVDLRKIMLDILGCHATKVIIAHNHPGGICAPSSSDIQTTKQISDAFENMKISLADHIIIADNDYYSFAEHSTTRDYLRTEQTNIYISDKVDRNEEDNFDRID